MRAIVRSTLLAGLTGTMMLGAAWAGIGISPPPVPSDPLGQLGSTTSDPTTAAGDVAGGATSGGTSSTSTAALAGGVLRVGAAKTSMYPRPGDYGGVWETDPAKCKTTEPAWFADLPTAAVNALDGIASTGSVWPENPNCIYQGGFSIGPVNPVKAFDAKYGLWVRSMAFSDGVETVVMTVVDAEGWLWDYEKKCTDCGAKQIAAALAADPDLAAKGVTAASHILHATHAHASPDFIGGWGFVPNWYMKQITDTIKATAKQAVMTMEAAKLETGEVEARAHNSERRDTYRSPEESTMSWMRAVAVDPAPTAVAPAAAPDPTTSSAVKGKGKPSPSTSPSPSPSPSPTETTPPAPRVIATMGAYAAHPTAVGTNGNVAHPDWPGEFERRLEERFGGIGLHFQTGLGNMSNSGGLAIGTRLADLLPAVGGGRPVVDTTVRVARTTMVSALTNVPLTTLGTAGLFDRKFTPGPAVVRTGKSADTAPCISTSPQSVELPATAARIGDDIVLTAAPGEVFSNFSNTVEEKNAGRITFALAQANDALGYMPQSFEINPVGQQGLGFVGGGYVFVNYEDSYAVDRCVGDLVLETTLTLMQGVKAARP
jgi:hypothetical protein